MRLATLFAAGTGLLATMGVIAAAAMVAITSELRVRTESIAAAVESVRVAAELEIEFLVHDRERRLLAVSGNDRHRHAMAHSAAAVRRLLASAREHAGTEEERQILRDAEVRAQEYLDEVDRAPPEERRRALTSVLDAVEALVALNTVEAELARTSASRLDTVANAAGLLVAAGLLIGIGAVLVVARTQLYRPLVQLRNGVEEFKRGLRKADIEESGAAELRQIASDFNAMARALEDQRTRQLQFVAGVAHDLRNPLQTLRATVGAWERAGDASDPARTAKAIGRVATQTERLQRMVDDLLDQTRIEAGNVELRRAAVDLRAVVREVAESHDGRSERHVIEAQVPDEPVTAWVDPARMAQVLENVVGNAIKYSPRGGRVQVRLCAGPHAVEVAVSDEGMGIAPHDLERIFEPFRRAAASEAAIPGIGLGLSVARRIVEGHGGRIEVESRLGRGSTFRIFLPLHT